MNMFKKNGGFTLVELIVVIAILAILAGIAVPAYSGYLKSAQKAGDITTLSAVKTAAVAAKATTGEVEKIDVTVDATGKVTSIMVNSTEIMYKTPLTGEEKNNDNFITYMNGEPDFTLKFFTEGATWAGSEWGTLVEETESTTEDPSAGA